MEVAIVGGGISGLCIASQLAELGHRVALFEKGRLGGQALGFRYRGSPHVFLEKFSHHVLPCDTAILDLIDRHGLEVLTPTAPERDEVHRIIYDELCLGKILSASRESYRRIMNELARRGAQAIILGCTEISLLVGEKDSPVPLLDTTAIHAQSAVEAALASR